MYSNLTNGRWIGLIMKLGILPRIRLYRAYNAIYSDVIPHMPNSYLPNI